jgi:N-acetyl-gamma-glutamyl-phosphate reductase
MSIKVFIDGAAGTTGLQIRERMAREPHFEAIQLGEADRKSPTARAQAMNACDFTILCLPDDAAREAVALAGDHVRIIDASSAHRTSPGWVYGLPELNPGQEAAIRNAARVSNPGCYPTGAIVLMRPLVDAGLLPASHAANVFAISGYSGAGAGMIRSYEAAHEAGEDIAPMRGYALGLKHKHQPEMRLYSGLNVTPNFMPVLGDFAQGILLYVPLHASQLARPARATDLHEALARHYQGSAHVHVQPLFDATTTEYLRPDSLNGTNDINLYVMADADETRYTLAAVYDNLGKGASGAAMQNLKLMAGELS